MPGGMKFNQAPRIKNVEGDEGDKKTFDDEPTLPGKPKVQAEQLRNYREEGQRFLDSYDRFFKTYARDISLSYRLSDKFYINLERGEVNLDTRWFADRGYTKEQILWACLHELEHFRDLAEDPEGMKKTFEYMRVKAKSTGNKLANKWEEAFGKEDPEFIQKLKNKPPPSKQNPRPMSQVESTGYKIHDTFYNIFDDIYVNNSVRRRAGEVDAAITTGCQYGAVGTK